jgi:ribosomal 50S subunit-recycling heat shock protein
MRLDKFLQVTGFFRRTAAKEACEEGKVLVDQMPARPAKEVAAGQMIDIEAGRRTILVEVLQVPIGNVARGNRSQFIRIAEEKDRGE